MEPITDELADAEPRRRRRSLAPAYEPLADRITRELRDGILERKYTPGSSLRQETIAKEMGVSRLPVREALRRLESEGLVVIRPHSGARVVVLDFEECVEIYKIRERLEPLAFSESVGKLSEEQIGEVRERSTELESLTHDHLAWLEADRSLHLAMYSGMRDSRLLNMIVGFWNTTQGYRRILLRTFTAEDFRIAHAEHLLMVAAIERGNAPAGEAVLRSAMERSRLRLENHRELFDQ